MGPRRHPALDGIGLRRAAGRQPGSIIPIAGNDGYHNAANGNRCPVANADANHCADADLYPNAGANRHSDAGPITNPGADGNPDANASTNPHAPARCAAGSHRQRRLCR